jgi:N-acyl-D-aspartate/D-glutamate deacylase
MAAALSAQTPQYDLLIRNGLVVDGTGAAPRRADVAVKGDRIARVGMLGNATAKDVVDANGLYVAPGFIDVHTHADDLASHPAAENFVRMGVTTVVAGNCGSSPVKVGEALAAIRKAGPAINFATLIGHNSVREQVMGTARRAPTAAELDAMKTLVATGVREGAVGFSTGLQYVPGTYAEPAEIVALATSAAAEGGIYASHMRNEGTELEKAVAETIAVGDAARCPVEISHLKVDSPKNWGAGAKALALIDAARKRGLDVQADQYAYDAASSGLGIRFPSWVLEGTAEDIKQRFENGADWLKIKHEMAAMLEERGLNDYAFAVVASYRPQPAYNGLSIKQIAKQFDHSESLDAQLEMMKDMLLHGGASMVYHFMSDQDIDRIMQHPFVSIASDASILTLGDGVPHPRGYGNNARVLGRYVREKDVLPLAEAVRKMTSLPASHFGFGDRGLIKEGLAADLVVFDADKVADTATYQEPHHYPAGIPHVFVNGVAVVRDGRQTTARPGQVVRRQTSAKK